MGDLIDKHLAVDDGALEERWRLLQMWLKRRFGRDVGLEGILFLIGIQSRGRGYEPKLGKDAKQDAIMEGTFCAFETLGLYERIGLDEDGSWLWERSVDHIPKLPIEDQEKLLKQGVLNYFAAYLET